MRDRYKETLLGRGLAVLLVAGLGLSLAGPVLAAKPKKGTHHYEYGKDITAWYWKEQTDQPVAPPAPLPPPVPPVEPRVRLPNPQRPDTIPVAVNQAQHERMSAIKFELSERGVTPGSTIKKLILSIQESQDRNEHPSFRPETAKIQACRINDVLAPGDAERFEERPPFAEKDCVEGKREVPAPPNPPVWRFELTKISDPWGKDPFSNNGVMLIGVIQGGGASETWQVNLKIPSRDDPGTQPDEYDQTKQRASIELEFEPGEDPGTAAKKGSKKGVPLDTGVSTGPATGGIPSAGSGFTPSTDLAGSSTGGFPGSAAPAPASPSPPAQTTPVAQTGPAEPRLPAYVWLLIPVGLLALSAVRSAVLEPVGGPRPDGVIAAIRRRNAERRGGPLREVTDPLARFTASLSHGTRAAIRTTAAGARSLGRLVRRARPR
jgi:hypothetical protein